MINLPPTVLKIFYRIGWLLIIGFSFLGIPVFSKTLYIPFLPIGFIFLPIGIGFFLITPWLYKEADERRKERGEISYAGISSCAKSLLMGFIFIFVFFLFILKT
ncbi:MAG: hypothetical protein LBK44_03010 [Spirochaetales bacterium]|jgi:hypothetical protein|nr:hypothetical protein [Spirochaetales bacterium]